MNKTTSPSDAKELLKASRRAFWKGVFLDNPVFCQVLGVCSALAVTTLVSNALVMGVAVIFVTAMSNVIVSLLRRYIPRRVRMIVEVVIIAGFVIAFDLVLKAYMFSMSQSLGPYVGLIITNCIVMGRAECFALQNHPVPSFFDGVGNGVGYTIVLCVVAVIRECLGTGIIFAGTPLAIIISTDVIPATTPYLLQIPIDFAPAQIMTLAPGAFFTIGILIALFRVIKPVEDSV